MKCSKLLMLCDSIMESVIEFGIIENSVNDFNTPDFGVHLGLIFRVG